MTRIAVLGTGLIGGSLGMALSARGHEVVAFDRNGRRLQRAVELGAAAVAASSVAEAVESVDLVFVSTPVGTVVDLAVAALHAEAPVVTDVGSVKSPVVANLEARVPELASRFVGGHPMAGSEQEGVDGADAGLFTGATWVLTPTANTDADAFSTVRAHVAELGAEVLAVTPQHHDLLVALVSHVPQLAATTLMEVADRHEEEHRALLRLAAGGFRDMTRIAAGHPGIWPDILTANRSAVVEALDAYLDALSQVRGLVAGEDRAGLLELMERARAARRSLPVGVSPDAALAEIRVPVPDRPGILAEITTLAGELGVNVYDVELAHSLEGDSGVMVMVVPLVGADPLEAALAEHGYHSARTVLS